MTTCYHCGDPCKEEVIKFEDKSFCCQGCQTVYEILNQNDLCDYYKLEQMPGISPKVQKQDKFAYLENEDIKEQLLDYKDDSISRTHLYLPQIHCSSCLWLLENLYRLQPAIQQSRVNFLKKEVTVTYSNTEFSLRQLVELLANIGYEPEINLDRIDQPKKKAISRKLMYQVGLAGFAFGNIMLLSLPEYFGLDLESYEEFAVWFGYLNLLIATPVAFYSGWDYFKSAWISLRSKRLNIDVPIALGILVLYIRSLYEVVSQTGAGYFDSLCGLLFFLLLGRIFQEKTYHRLSFERDYKAYFPISVVRIKNNEEKTIPVNEIQKGDRILIHNGELIPVDGILIRGDAQIDNSFATGESKPISKESGDRIYAGGRQQGEAIEIEALRPLSQSKLTSLWNDQVETIKTHNHFSEITDKISEWFTPIILIIAIISGVLQWANGLHAVVQVVSAVLIVACPCALALAAPFTFGHTTRWLGRQNCYLRESAVVEDMANLNHIVFDKTGTLTYSNNQSVNYNGTPLTAAQQSDIHTILRQSNHPLSRLIFNSIQQETWSTISEFEEIPAKGLTAKVGELRYKIGAPKWVGMNIKNTNDSVVAISINDEPIGYYTIFNEYRTGLDQLLNKLSTNYGLSLISGDNDGQKDRLISIFPKGSELIFNQSPKEKMDYIEQLQNQNLKVMMVGDGLNDAGALKKSNVGVALAEDVNAFSPACDLILSADAFNQLDQILTFAKSAKKIVIISFIISFLYNIVGLSFAVQGLLSPVTAAILMPISSISVVGFSTIAVWVASKKVK